MESPVKDIVGVVEGLVRAKDANSQRDVLQRYFTDDASFDHPLCAVSSYSNVRAATLATHWLTMPVEGHGGPAHLSVAAHHV